MSMPQPDEAQINVNEFAPAISGSNTASNQFHIQLLGSLEVRRPDGATVPFKPQQTGILLAYLALRADRAHTREGLAELIWPDTAPEEARHNLRQSLYSLRRQLDPSRANLIQSTATSVELNRSLVTTDVEAYDKLVRRAELETDTRRRLSALLEAARAYAGELLPGFYLDAILTERTRLAISYHHLLISISRAYEQLGDITNALDYAHRACALDETDEATHRWIMQLLHQSGNLQGVNRQFRQLESALSEQLSVQPSQETIALLNRLRRTDAAAAVKPNRCRPA